MPSWFGRKTDAELAAEKEAQEHAQRTQELLNQRPAMVTHDDKDREAVQKFRANEKVLKAQREQQVRELTERKNLVNNPATKIGDDMAGVARSDKLFPNLGSKNRPEVQAVREKMARAQEQYPDSGVLGVHQHNNPPHVGRFYSEPSVSKEFNLGSRDRAEVQAVREKMEQAQEKYPDRGVLGVFKHTKAEQIVEDDLSEDSFFAPR